MTTRIAKSTRIPSDTTPEERARHAAEAESLREKAEEAERLAVSRTIEALRNAATSNNDEAARLERLLARFPGLRKYTGRWGKVAYYAKEVNPQAMGYDHRHNCGCCADSPLEVWPFLETEDGRVYTDPPMFFVGERDYDSPTGERPKPGWEEQLRSKGIPETLIERIGCLFPSKDEQESQEE